MVAGVESHHAGRQQRFGFVGMARPSFKDAGAEQRPAQRA